MIFRKLKVRVLQKRLRFLEEDIQDVGKEIADINETLHPSNSLTQEQTLAVLRERSFLHTRLELLQNRMHHTRIRLEKEQDGQRRKEQ